MQNSNIRSNASRESSDSNNLLVNRLSVSDYTFTVYDYQLEKSSEINLFHPKLTPAMQFWICECFVCLLGGWDNPTLQTLSGRTNTLKSFKSTVLRIGVWASAHYPSLPMSQWKEFQVKEIIQDILNDNIDWKRGEHWSGSEIRKGTYPLNRNAVYDVFLALEKTKHWKLTGKISDGIGFDFPKAALKIYTEETLESYGISYEAWTKKNVRDAIPLPVSMALLHHAYTILTDKKTLFLIDYFKFQRGENRLSIRSIFTTGGFNDYCNELLTKEPKKRHTKEFLSRVEPLKAIISDHYDGEITRFPMSIKEVVQHCNDVYDSCIVIFLCLTGVRISEMASVFSDDYQQEADGVWTFKSDIEKTNHGISEVREMAGMVATAAQAMVNLSYIDKHNRPKKDPIHLFGRYFYKGDYNDRVNVRRNHRTITEGSIRQRLDDYYDNFLKLHPELSLYCPSISPHRFRHTLAEFALRRFEGNVFEQLRRHFRHAFGSYFTTSYVFNKLSAEVRDQIEKDYLKEILTRIVKESARATLDENFKRDLYGKTVKAVSRAMGTIVLTEDEIHDYVETLAEEFDSIVAHEYGYCLVRRDTKHLAKCIDIKTQTPIITNGCFELCSGCVHNLNSACSNKSSITRIAVSHNQLIESFTETFGKNVKSELIETSKAVLMRAEVILEEMEEK